MKDEPQPQYEDGEWHCPKEECDYTDPNPIGVDAHIAEEHSPFE